MYLSFLKTIFPGDVLPNRIQRYSFNFSTALLINLAMKKLFWHCLSLVFLICYHPSSGQQAAPLLKRVVIIRHGEKPDRGDNLSCPGLNRALQLPDVLNKKFGIPNSIFVPSINTGKKTSAARMYQTIVPFAVKYNLNINSKYDVDDTKGLAGDILTKDGTVLLVWEHKHIDNILKALGVQTSGKWADEDFDSIWIINFQSGKAILTKDKEGINPGTDCK
jgi:hypothetical protein